MKDRSKNVKLEIIRFVVIGVVATIVDAGVRALVTYLISGIPDIAVTIISVLCGFAASVVVNYVFSVLWVFQNVKDKKKSKTQKSFWLFVGLGFIGLLFHWGLNIGAELLFNLGGISITEGQRMIFETIKDGTWSFLWNINFWMWVLIFVLGTLIVLVWNYLSRKKWIFVAPKEGETEVREAKEN
ncbi:MAG: GtrA family protein [Bacilli bacterium]|nr:GtrA family protein [Bacilli bacterium]